MKKYNRIQWRMWEKLGEPKDKGGLGLRDLENFDKALLAKQLFQILQTLDSLTAQDLKSKYFSSSTLLNARVRANSSFMWKSFMAALDLVKNG